jgi:uncharacterized protein YndB with AHSA1/START domain
MNGKQGNERQGDGARRGSARPSRQIVKEIVIDAPPSKVWPHLIDTAKVAGWLMPNDFQARVGSPFFLDCENQGRIDCVVKEVVAERRLVYSWQSKETRVETTVTITLTAEGDRTRVKLVHSGWDALPPADQDGIMGGFDRGWSEHLAKLREQIVARGGTR